MFSKLNALIIEKTQKDHFSNKGGMLCQIQTG